VILAPLFVAVAPASPTIPPFFRLDYLEALAAEVDARIQQLYATSAQISPLRAAIMAIGIKLRLETCLYSSFLVFSGACQLRQDIRTRFSVLLCRVISLKTS